MLFPLLRTTVRGWRRGVKADTRRTALKRAMIVLATLMLVGMLATVFGETVRTRLGWMSFTHDFANGYPTDETVEKLYDEHVDTRCLIRNEQKIADRSSLMDLLINEDGSVDIHIGPDAPKGREKNWIPTVAGRAWFPYFRLYSPKPAFLDRTWVLPDIEKRR
jgi:hypothetical protein